MSDNQVEDIKAKIDIIDLISSYLPLKKRGRNFMACCPFHSEKTPSFTVSPELQIYKCFGCGKAGDIFSFIEEYEKVDFREALEILAKRAGVTLKVNPNISKAQQRSSRLVLANLYIAKFYHFVLTKHPQGKIALDYLKSRGITDKTIEDFNIGFSPNNSKSLLNLLKKKGFSDYEILETGTFGKKGNYFYDRFRQRLTFPLIDHRDRIVAFSGRILPTSDNQNLAKYINSPETSIYHKGHMFFGLNLTKKSIRDKDQAIVVEGEFDLISPYQAGFTNIVALKGTAFTKDQLSLLKRYTTNLLLSLDSDFAGANAARKSIQMADSMGFDIKVLDLGDYKDPDDAIQADLKFYQKQLKNSLSIWDFIIKSSLKNFDPSTDKGKKQILDFTFPFIIQISNLVIRSTYLAKLAQLLDVDKQAIFQEANRFSRFQQKVDTKVIIPTQVDDTNPLKTEQMQQYLLTLIFSQDKPHRFIKKVEADLDALDLPQFKKILKILSSYKLKTFIVKKFIKKLPDELIDLFNQIYIEAKNDSQDKDWTIRQVKKTANSIKLTKLKQKQRQISLKIARVEQQKNSIRLKKLELLYNKILNQISLLQQ